MIPQNAYDLHARKYLSTKTNRYLSPILQHSLTMSAIQVEFGPKKNKALQASQKALDARAKALRDQEKAAAKALKKQNDDHKTQEKIAENKRAAAALERATQDIKQTHESTMAVVSDIQSRSRASTAQIAAEEAAA